MEWSISAKDWNATEWVAISPSSFSLINDRFFSLDVESSQSGRQWNHWSRSSTSRWCAEIQSSERRVTTPSLVIPSVSFQGLTVLILWQNSIDDEGLSHLAEGLKHNQVGERSLRPSIGSVILLLRHCWNCTWRRIALGHKELMY